MIQLVKGIGRVAASIKCLFPSDSSVATLQVCKSGNPGSSPNRGLTSRECTTAVWQFPNSMAGLLCGIAHLKEEVLDDKTNKRDREITRERERRKSVVEEEVLVDKRNERDGEITRDRERERERDKEIGGKGRSS